MRYVVVGAGAAGISAARTLRQLDREGDIEIGRAACRERVSTLV